MCGMTRVHTFRQAALAVLALATLVLVFHVLGAPEWFGG
jgi:hypothetical protein